MIMEVPPKEIIFDQVLYWINLQATQEEVASSFRVSVETLNARLKEHFGMSFSELKKRTDGEGKLSLRRYQFKQAEKNATMAIFLGKNWLDQSDGRDDRATPPNDKQLTLNHELMLQNAEFVKEMKELRKEIAQLKKEKANASV